MYAAFLPRNDMIIRKKFTVFHLGLAKSVVLAASLASLAGCNSLGSLIDPDRVDYRSASKAPTLDVPPDLTQLQRDSRYAIPDTSRGTATASSFNLSQGNRAGVAPSVAQVGTVRMGDVRVERAGDQRWLVVKRAPEALWPQVKDFWQDSGFVINLELQAAGVMETDWAENRAKIPQDMIRNTIGKVLDSLYSTGERDKFRTRIERSPDGGSEIYISHRGAEEVLVGQFKESTTWTARKPDPALEAQFLVRLMARLGVEEEKAKEAVANANPQTPRAKFVKNGASTLVEVDEGFDRAWRRIGLVLDRAGFTVEDRDRVSGMYFVRYLDPELDAKGKPAGEKGFFSRLFSFGSADKSSDAPRYRIVVKAQGEVSQVTVLNNEGKVESSTTAEKILKVLADQLK